MSLNCRIFISATGFKEERGGEFDYAQVEDFLSKTCSDEVCQACNFILVSAL